MDVLIRAVGFVRGGRHKAVDDDWDKVHSEIVLDSEQFSAESLLGLNSFSHVEILFHFHRGDPKKMVIGARRPRDRAEWPKVGIFAQRGSPRPNRMGITVCRVLSVCGLTLHVQGLDAIDGTPVFDIKPYFSGFGPRGNIEEPDWAKQIMNEYWFIEKSG